MHSSYPSSRPQYPGAQPPAPYLAAAPASASHYDPRADYASYDAYDAAFGPGPSAAYSPARDVRTDDLGNSARRRVRQPRTPRPPSESSSSASSKQPSPEDNNTMLNKTFVAGQQDQYQTSPPRLNMVPEPDSPTMRIRRVAARSAQATRYPGQLTAYAGAAPGNDDHYLELSSRTPRYNARGGNGAPVAGHAVPLQAPHEAPREPYPTLLHEPTTPTAAWRAAQHPRYY